jgi:hypothetical protein
MSEIKDWRADDTAPQYNKTSIGGVKLSSLMGIKHNSGNAAKQINGDNKQTPGSASPREAKQDINRPSYAQRQGTPSQSFDDSIYQRIAKSMKGISGGKNINDPSNRSNSKSVGA